MFDRLIPACGGSKAHFPFFRQGMVPLKLNLGVKLGGVHPLNGKTQIGAFKATQTRGQDLARFEHWLSMQDKSQLKEDACKDSSNHSSGFLRGALDAKRASLAAH